MGHHRLNERIKVLENLPDNIKVEGVYFTLRIVMKCRDDRCTRKGVTKDGYIGNLGVG